MSDGSIREIVDYYARVPEESRLTAGSSQLEFERNPDFDTRWKDSERRAELLKVARLLEEETSIIGVSAHLLAVGTKE